MKMMHARYTSLKTPQVCSQLESESSLHNNPSPKPTPVDLQTLSVIVSLMENLLFSLSDCLQVFAGKTVKLFLVIPDATFLVSFLWL